MAHIPAETLSEALKEASAQVPVGSAYRHFKNPDSVYIVTGFGILEATDEVAVIYQSQAGENITFIRPLASWAEQVELDGQYVARFTKI